MKTSLQTVDNALKNVSSGSRIFIQGSTATPTVLLKALFERKNELSNVELVSVSTLGNINFNKTELGNSFFINSLFVSKNVRDIVNTEQGDYIPVFLSEIHLLFEKGILPLDFAFIHVSPPDKHGFSSLCCNRIWRSLFVRKKLRQRAMALLKIAHPLHREWLEKEIIKRFVK